MKSAVGSVCSYLSMTSGVIGVTRGESAEVAVLTVKRSPKAMGEMMRVQVCVMDAKRTGRATHAQARETFGASARLAACANASARQQCRPCGVRFAYL